MVRQRPIVVAALLPLFCSSCGTSHRHSTFMIDCLRRVENHTPAKLRMEVAKRECGWSPKRTVRSPT
jgi:hypothetical protein